MKRISLKEKTLSWTSSSLLSNFFSSGCFSGSRACLHNCSEFRFLGDVKVRVRWKVCLGGGLKWSSEYSSKVCGFSWELKPFACEYSVRCSSKLLSLKMASVEEVGLFVVGSTYRYSSAKRYKQLNTFANHLSSRQSERLTGGNVSLFTGSIKLHLYPGLFAHMIAGKVILQNH